MIIILYFYQSKILNEWLLLVKKYVYIVVLVKNLSTSSTTGVLGHFYRDLQPGCSFKNLKELPRQLLSDIRHFISSVKKIWVMIESDSYWWGLTCTAQTLEPNLIARSLSLPGKWWINIVYFFGNILPVVPYILLIIITVTHAVNQGPSY